ncbi:MAG: DNA-protecting protein DprA [Bacteroidota bacterium]
MGTQTPLSENYKQYPVDLPCDENEALALLRLQTARGLGIQSAHLLLTLSGTAQALWNPQNEDQQQARDLAQIKFPDLFSTTTDQRAVREWARIQSLGLWTWCLTSGPYPFNLKQCPDAPLMLFGQGPLSSLGLHHPQRHRKLISVVGTRSMTPYGQDFLIDFMADLATTGVVIVSGLAQGVDICAQLAAHKNGLPTISCLAHGMHQIYPAHHKKYIPLLLEQGGLITEYWYGERAQPAQFVRRNRIIAGLSEVTLVVESPRKGGSMITAHLAKSYERTLCAVPGRTNDLNSAGCLDVLAKPDYAHLVRHAADLFCHMGWDDFVPQTRKQLVPALNLAQQDVLRALRQRGRATADHLSVDTRRPVGEVMGILLGLEIAGVLYRVEGGWFVPKTARN